MAEEQKTEKRNIEIQIAELKREAKENADLLSSAILRRVEAEDEEQLVKRRVEIEEERYAEIQTLCKSEYDSLNLSKENLNKEKQNQDLLLKTKKDEVKEAQKELSRLNGWILRANDEKDLKGVELDELDKKIELKKNLIEGIMSLEDQKKDLEEKNQELIMSNSILEEEGRKQLEDLKLNLQKITKETDEKVIKADEAENRKKLFDTEYQIKKSDLEIYESRIKKDFKDSGYTGRLKMIPSKT